jgi:Domain of unknown function (DUF1841)
MPKNFNPHLQAAILEAVENQLADNDPPETRKTYQRLIREGHSEKDAKKLIGCVVVAEIFSVMKQEKPFDHARFVEALNRLPEIPE